MKYVKNVVSIDFIDTNDNITNFKVEDFDGTNISDLLQYSSIKLDIESNDEDLVPQIHRYSNESPYFKIIKILKPIGFKRLVFRDKNDKEIYWITFINKINDQDLVNSICLLRMFDSDEDLNFEQIMHENSNLAHKDEILNNFNGNYMSKKFTDLIYSEDKTSTVNSNIMTKNFQIFNLGNLLEDSDELMNNKNKSSKLDIMNVNNDVNINEIIDIEENSDYGLGELL